MRRIACAGRHAERARRLGLAAVDRLDAAAVDLGRERRRVQRDAERRRGQRADLERQQDRQRVVEPEDLHQHRRVAEELDEGRRRQ
jgi:hypothetical protein